MKFPLESKVWISISKFSLLNVSKKILFKCLILNSFDQMEFASLLSLKMYRLINSVV